MHIKELNLARFASMLTWLRIARTITSNMHHLQYPHLHHIFLIHTCMCHPSHGACHISLHRMCVIHEEVNVCRKCWLGYRLLERNTSSFCFSNHSAVLVWHAICSLFVAICRSANFVATSRQPYFSADVILYCMGLVWVIWWNGGGALGWVIVVLCLFSWCI